MLSWKIVCLASSLFLLYPAHCSPSIDKHPDAKNSTSNDKEKNQHGEKSGFPTPRSTIKKIDEPALTYSELLTKISERCISIEQYEEAYGNKAKAGVVKLFFTLLAQEAYDQIAIDELRRILHLKPQKVNTSTEVEEEFEEGADKTLDITELKTFQQNIRTLQQAYWSRQMFSTKDISISTAFFERRFPEIRKAFRLKFKEESDRRTGGKWDKYSLQELFRIFLNTRVDVAKAVKKSDWISANGDILPGGPKCQDNFE